MKKLVFFTNSYPYSHTEDWKARELCVLRRYFHDIVVVPLMSKVDAIAPDFPQGIRLAPPVLPSNDIFHSKFSVGRILNRRFRTHVSALKGAHSNDWREKTKRWLIASLNIENILSSEVFRRQITPELEGSYLYFYWAVGYAEILPFLARRLRQASLVRFHGFDLYWDRNSGYIPAQRAIVESAAVLAPISNDGAKFLRRHYPVHAQKIQCHRLGTSIRGASKPSDDGILRLVSCAYVTAGKRLNMIVECLQHIDRPTEWTHIGDGPLLPNLIELSRQLPAHVRCNLVGRLPPDQVAAYYENNSFDAFISVSESEGIPVSMMEAMAAGIPVVATNVGGISELVDDLVGRLLPADFTIGDFVAKVNELASIDLTTRDTVRARCRERITREYDMAINGTKIAKTLLALREGPRN